MASKTGQSNQVPTRKIRRILISQPRPESEKSPYFDLAKNHGVEIDFYPFIRVEGVSAKEFRKQRIDIQQYTAVIFTSRNAVDHFFRICDELKVKVSQDCKYFCITEAVALYLQKFILYRKRKVFYGADGTLKSLLDVIAKHKQNEKFLIPCSDQHKPDIEEFLEQHHCQYATAMLYRTVSNDVREVVGKGYDVIVFFSPAGVKSLLENFPNFEQNGTYIGAFGANTSQAVEEAGLRLDIRAPLPDAPSMVSALDLYLRKLNQKK
ncbi:MAG: uroporphyrinogen-III synthase [Thermoflavifilum sp.]|nr:uroporphyrinogen-III synthase [Thermoflavifilum sp.]